MYILRYYVNEKYQFYSRGHERSMGSYISVIYILKLISSSANHIKSYNLVVDNKNALLFSIPRFY